MRIAVIGWGSLIWCPGSLQIRTKWRPNGPVLPIEFARISSDGRLTLVIHPGSQEVQTYWALSTFDTLAGAQENLREREGTRAALIDVVRASDNHGSDAPGAKKAVHTWLATQQNLDCAIWTALPGNWEDRRGHPFSQDDAVQYLSELKAKRDEAELRYVRACEYIRNAPAQIRTDVREMLRDKADFKAATLSAILFEPRPGPGDE